MDEYKNNNPNNVDSVCCFCAEKTICSGTDPALYSPKKPDEILKNGKTKRPLRMERNRIYHSESPPGVGPSDHPPTGSGKMLRDLYDECRKSVDDSWYNQCDEDLVYRLIHHNERCTVTLSLLLGTYPELVKQYPHLAAMVDSLPPEIQALC